MSTPGIQTAAAIIAFCRETERISSSTTGSRSTGRRAARPVASLAELPRDRLGDRAAPEARAPGRAKTRSVSSTYGRLVAVGHADDRHLRERRRAQPRLVGLADPDERGRAARAAALAHRRRVAALAQLAREQRHERPRAVDDDRPPVAAARARLADEREHARPAPSAACSSAAPPPAADVDRLQDPHRRQVRDHRRAADRDERQRDAGDRRDADRHADVDEDLEDEREHEPAGDDRAEQVRGARRRSSARARRRAGRAAAAPTRRRSRAARRARRTRSRSRARAGSRGSSASRPRRRGRAQPPAPTAVIDWFTL